jgi:hypothetical protein
MILAIAGTAICGGLLGMATDNDFNTLDAPLVLIGVTFILFNPVTLRMANSEGMISELDQFNHRTLPACLTLTSFGFFILFGVLFCFSRYRIYAIGDNRFFQDMFLEHVSYPTYFEGLQSASRFIAVLHEIEGVFGQTRALTDYPDSIFFGERLQFGYAAYRLPSPKGIFCAWPGAQEATQEQVDTATRNFIRWKPKLCIFLLNDFTYIPKGILEFLNPNYTIRNTSNLTILTLKK